MLGALLLAGCVLPGAGISPHGRVTTVYPTNGVSVSGELLAANRDSVWLLADGTLMGMSTAEIRKINVRRHGFDGKKTFVWMALAGGGTGIALLSACTSYDASEPNSSSDCGGVLPASVLLYLAVGGLLAFANEYSSKYHLRPSDERVRTFARFPQGLPDSVSLRLRSP